jgi:hypothetical protein
MFKVIGIWNTILAFKLIMGGVNMGLCLPFPNYWIVGDGGINILQWIVGMIIFRKSRRSLDLENQGYIELDNENIRFKSFKILTFIEALIFCISCFTIAILGSTSQIELEFWIVIATTSRNLCIGLSGMYILS